MLFSEPQFFLFFAFYAVLHVMLPAQYRLYLIIAGGAVFYSWWRPDYLWIPFGLSLVAFYGTAWIDGASNDISRKQRLWAVLVVLFVPLLIVKYTYFIFSSILGMVVDPAALLADPTLLRWALPLGISFITFTAMAYVVDVYRRKYVREHSLVLMLGYMLFFPHLIAGPILRPHELMPQLKRQRPARNARMLLGVAIFTLGLVKKLVFADQIASAVEPIYGGAAGLSAWHYLIAIYGFSVQIYCDFSGYTDMAIGLSYLLRIRLPTNFLRPYSSASLTEFWRRWHITLSHWLRDYLYIPLGGNRMSQIRQMINLLVTMILGGLWHGANWNFAIWGAIHGVGLGASHLLKGKLVLPRWIGIFITFHFVTLAWVFFRASDMATAIRILTGPFRESYGNAFQTLSLVAFPSLLILLFLLTHQFDRHARLRWASVRTNRPFQWGVIALMWIIAVTVSEGSSAKFIYFDF